MGQVFDPSVGGTTTSLGALLNKVVMLIFFVGGGFLAFLGLMYKSYQLWPVFSYVPKFGNIVFPTFVLNVADILMQNTALLAAPVVIVMFLVEFGLGMMNRFAPQLNVFSLSMPIKSGVAMFMFILYFPILYSLFELNIIDGQKLIMLFQKIL